MTMIADWMNTLQVGGCAAEKLAIALMGSRSIRVPQEVSDLAQSVLHQRRERARAEAAQRRELKAAGLDVLRDPETGSPVEIQGYCMTYCAPSGPQRCNAGAREMLWPGAFDAANLARVFITIDHDHANPLPGQLTLGLDVLGVAFRLSQIPVTPQSQAMLADVERGLLRHCSFSFRGSYLGQFRDWEGERVFAVEQVGGLFEICLTASPTFAATAAWASHRQPARGVTRAARVGWDVTAARVEWITCHPPRQEAAR